MRFTFNSAFTVVSRLLPRRFLDVIARRSSPIAMSAPYGNGSQFPASAGSSSGTFSVPDFEDLPFITELRIIAQQAYKVYQTRGDLNALDVCIQSNRIILDMIEDDSPEKAATLANLGVPLRARYEATGELRDLKESISLEQLANALTPDHSPDKYRQLQNLAVSLVSLFEREGGSEDLEEAIDLQTRAIELVPGDHADKPTLLHSLGTSLHVRFKHSGTLDDLDKAISLQIRAVDLTPDGDPDKPMRLMDLGTSLHTRYKQLGSLEDVERAVKLHSRAVELTPDGNPNKTMCLNGAGNSLETRYERLGNADDLSQAIKFRSRAVDMPPDSHPLKPGLLNNLAGSLRSRYEWTGDARDLEQAVAHQTRAVALTPDGHPGKASRLNNLGIMLHTQFERSGSLEDLDAAIAHQRTAVALAPDGHVNKQMWLYNLSNSLRRRFDRVGDATDLAEAIRCSTRSVELLPENHPYRTENLRLLGHLLVIRLSSPHAHANDATQAMEAFFAAMRHPTSHPYERLRASGLYTRLLTEFSHLLPPSPPLSLLAAYQHAIDLIPQCIWLGNDVCGRYTSKEVKLAGLRTNEAAAAAITAKEYSLALEWLEAGRAVVTSQVLQLRTPLDDLRLLHPPLADELHQVSQALQHAATGDNLSSTPLPISTANKSHLQATSSHGYALRYDALIAQVRKLKGFEDFMRPKKLSQLTGACAAGPVVVINVDQSRCDALVFHSPGEVKHVALPSFSIRRAAQLHSKLVVRCPRGRFRDGAQDDRVEDRGANMYGRGGVNDPLYDILQDLWKLVVKPIFDAIRSLPIAPTREAATPNHLHITWCPTGPLTFLPLHAAGIYGRDGRSESIMDYAVSSYTPTLQALLKPRVRRASTLGEDSRILIVSQPATPNYSPIPKTTIEAAIVMLIAGRSDDSIVLDDKDGTVDAVIKGMETHDWVHLACHGIQDPDDPTKSAFILYDDKLTLNTLMSKSLPHAELAVLSACQTAKGNPKLSNEAAHLAAGVLSAGYKSVIGTMWSISDASAPKLMEVFYREMMAQVDAGGELQPAYALHNAVQVLRKECNEVYNRWDWLPFVHFGL